LLKTSKETVVVHVSSQRKAKSHAMHFRMEIVLEVCAVDSHMAPDMVDEAEDLVEEEVDMVADSVEEEEEDMVVAGVTVEVMVDLGAMETGLPEAVVAAVDGLNGDLINEMNRRSDKPAGFFAIRCEPIHIKSS